MNNKFWYVIGLMSGTSLDGVDLVYVKFNKNNYSDFEILEKECYNYSQKWKNILTEAFSFSGENLIKLHVDYGNFLAEKIKDFITQKSIKKIDLLASHGHTIFHQPESGFTYQIGCGATMAKQTKLTTVCDFRTQDVAFGGQGAPLVPIGDETLFANYDFCLNLGGFANVSYQDDHDCRLAFDICPVNIVMNYYTRKIGLDYDDKGSMAASGSVNNDLLGRLNTLDFYNIEVPKSLGYEFVKSSVFPIIDTYNLQLEDILRTFIEHASIQIAKSLNAINKSKPSLLVTGGGAYNEFLIQRIENLCHAKIVVPKPEIIDYKEALIFALLGLLRFEDKTNCLASVTGAFKDHSSGVVYRP